MVTLKKQVVPVLLLATQDRTLHIGILQNIPFMQINLCSKSVEYGAWRRGRVCGIVD